nr:YshB family small membrane protein [Klebsiella pneumoniae subsp. pneumoniae]
MFESLVSMISSGAAASHTPQTAVAAVLCAALVGLFSIVPLSCGRGENIK